MVILVFALEWQYFREEVEMRMDLQSEREHLSQAIALAQLLRQMPPTEMIPVYSSDDCEVERRDYYIACVLVPSQQHHEALSSSWQGFLSDCWHWSPGPSAIEHCKDCDGQIEYYRYGNTDGKEPLVFQRSFWGVWENYTEVSEEFRHFHDLYHDRDRDQYLKLDDDKNELCIAVVKPSLVKIRLKEIRQFLAIKEMHLAILCESVAWSSRSLEELGISEGLKCDRGEELERWQLSYGDYNAVGTDRRAFSRLLGVRVVEPLPLSQSGFPGIADEPIKRYVDFIITMNDSGEEVERSCNPDVPEARPSDYLTPVSFRKTVLEKYYQQPSKYDVSPGGVWHASLWHLPIDYFHEDKVVVFLGDLARLPYPEQLHWRSENFATETGVSDTYCRSQLLAEFTTSDRPEHVIRSLYDELLDVCQKFLGWSVLLPLRQEDEYHLSSFRISVTNEQQDFDGLILGLTKVFVDSLNEVQLKKLVPANQHPSIEGSISLLDAVLSFCGVSDANEHIAFLRNLQSLRSAGSAHRKGRKYHKIAVQFGVGGQDLRTVFTQILENAVCLLEYLIKLVKEGKLRPLSG